MRRVALLFGFLFVSGFAVGCGGPTSSLSTDSGEMTIEEYTAVQAAEEAKIAESMKSQSN